MPYSQPIFRSKNITLLHVTFLVLCPAMQAQCIEVCNLSNIIFSYFIHMLHETVETALNLSHPQPCCCQSSSPESPSIHGHIQSRWVSGLSLHSAQNKHITQS